MLTFALILAAAITMKIKNVITHIRIHTRHLIIGVVGH